MNWYKKLLKRKYPYIVAEMEVKHEGSVEKAKQLVDEMVNMGVDCIKFQAYTIDNLYAPGTAPPDLKDYPLTVKQWKEIKKYCGKRIDFACTPFSEEDADMLEEVGVPFYKISSGDLTNFELLHHIALKKKPIVLSTGMGHMDEITNAVELIGELGNWEIILLHCVSLYPPKTNQLNLHNIRMLRHTFGLPIGYSDHTTHTDSAYVATALMASIIETHHPTKILVERCKRVPDMLGHYQRIISPDEVFQRLKFRREWVGNKFLRNPK